MRRTQKITFKNKAWIPALLLVSTLVACLSSPNETKVTSTSISTGNPVGVRILFRKDGAPTSLSCVARLYAVTQATIPDFQPTPLAAFPMTSASELQIGPQDLEHIPDSLWAKGSVEGDSIFAFNIVFDGTKFGTWVHGIEYHKRVRRFSLGGKAPDPIQDSLLTLSTEFTPFGVVHVGLQDSLDPKQEHYLYIPGTGFFGINWGNEFNLIIPNGSYAGAVVSRPKYIPVPPGLDSLPVFGLKDSIRFESLNPTSRSGIVTQVPIPASERLLRQSFQKQLTQVQFLFQSGGKQVLFTGSMDVYASTQIPVPGFRPEPLASFPIASVSEFTLDSMAFVGVPDSLWPMNSASGDSLARFNVFVAGKDSGALLPGFSFNRRSKTFARSVNDAIATKDKAIISYVDLRNYDSLSVHIDPEYLSGKYLDFLFVPGSPIVAQGDTGVFFLRAPKGSYSLSMIEIPGPNGPSSSPDSVSIFGLRFEAMTGFPTENAISSLIGLVALPDSLKH